MGDSANIPPTVLIRQASTWHRIDLVLGFHSLGYYKPPAVVHSSRIILALQKEEC